MPPAGVEAQNPSCFDLFVNIGVLEGAFLGSGGGWCAGWSSVQSGWSNFADEFLDIFTQNIRFNIHSVSDGTLSQRGDSERMGNQGHAEAFGFDVDQSQADAVYSD